MDFLRVSERRFPHTSQHRNPAPAIDRYRKRNAQKRVDSHMEDIAGEVEKIGSAISSDIEIYLKKKELVK